MHYGVQKLVAINSGNYVFAEVDVSKPVHFAAANNRGKSTLVNTLQFLYVDDFQRMRFGTRNPEDTRRHYFGNDRSYLIFECMTPSGLQCLLVRGLSSLRGGLFERYVYGGAFRQTDYVQENGQIREFPDVRSQLADRSLTKVRNAELWRVLSARAPAGSEASLPRLGLLPIRKREEYDAFRDVFARLLSLSAATVRTLKQLIIDSYAGNVAERRIDVATEYRDDFERVERSERELSFVRAAASEIDRGRTLRLESAALSDKLARSAPYALLETSRCQEDLTAKQQRLHDAVERLKEERSGLEQTRDQHLQSVGAAKTELASANAALDALAADHEKWRSYTPEFIAQMRRREQQRTAERVELERHLQQAATLDVVTMESQIEDRARQLASNQAAFAHWDRTAAAELRRAGITTAELDSAFRILNPDLLKLVVGETLSIANAAKAGDRVRAISQRVSLGNYKDDAVTADVTAVRGPDRASGREREELGKQIALETLDLKSLRARLAAAQDRQQSAAVASALNDEINELRKQLGEHDAFAVAWAARDGEMDRQKAATREVQRLTDGLSDLHASLDSAKEAAAQLGAEVLTVNGLKNALTSAAEQLTERLRRSFMDASLPDGEARVGRPPGPLEPYVQSLIKQLQDLRTDLQRIEDIRREVQTLQEAIRHKAQEMQAQPCYFGSEEEEWERLIESRESLSEREAANEKNWDALLKPLSARINGVVTAMRNIKLAVEGINRGLRSYQVSNLRAVEIAADEVHETYAALEALTGADGMFQDRDAVDDAKRKLRRMIDASQVIELQSLFELRIRTQLADGAWQEAASLDEIGSTGTGMTAKAMIFIQLVRAIATKPQYRLHFYIDGLGELDDQNLSATVAMALSRGVIPITADPRLHIEPLAQPEVTIYSLGQNEEGRFFIDKYRTYRARRSMAPSPSEASHDPR